VSEVSVAVRKDKRSVRARPTNTGKAARVVILRRGRQAVSASLAGNFLTAVDHVIMATGNSGPTMKRRSAGNEVHDHRPQMAVVLFAETTNLDFSRRGVQPLR